MKTYIFATAIALLSTPIFFGQTSQLKAHKLKLSTSIPKEYVGHWQKGSFSLTSFEQYDGKYVGPANETSVSYVIGEDGIIREYFISNTNSYNCRMQILGYRQGSMVVNTFDNSFEFEPTSGYYSTLTCMSKTTTKKVYTAKDLYPNYTVTATLKNDGNGNTVLAVKPNNGTEAIYRKLK